MGAIREIRQRSLVLFQMWALFLASLWLTSMPALAASVLNKTNGSELSLSAAQKVALDWMTKQAERGKFYQARVDQYFETCAKERTSQDVDKNKTATNEFAELDSLKEKRAQKVEVRLEKPVQTMRRNLLTFNCTDQETCTKEHKRMIDAARANIQNLNEELNRGLDDVIIGDLRRWFAMATAKKQLIYTAMWLNEEIASTIEMPLVPSNGTLTLINRFVLLQLQIPPLACDFCGNPDPIFCEQQQTGSSGGGMNRFIDLPHKDGPIFSLAYDNHQEQQDPSKKDQGNGKGTRF